MNLYEEAWKAIIAPPQIKGKLKNYGPMERVIDNMKILREDVRITNKNNKSLVGLIYHAPELNTHQTVLYLHGNGGTKYEAMPLIDLIPKFNINVAAFDFIGSGASDPGYLTYGVQEVSDIKLMVEQIRSRLPKQKIVLWGRSMGAQCAIMYAQMYPNDVSGMVLDSPFQYLSGVINRIAHKQTSFPDFILNPALYLIKKKVNEQVGSDIFSIDYLEIFKRITPGLPTLFVYSHFDSIVPTEQILKFYRAHQGPKDVCQIFQTHDQDRSQKVFQEGIAWIFRTKKTVQRKFISDEMLRSWTGNGTSMRISMNA